MLKDEIAKIFYATIGKQESYRETLKEHEVMDGVDKIISLIESHLPEVKEECRGCRGWRHIFLEAGIPNKTKECGICNGIGQTTRRMSWEEAIEKLRGKG